MLSQDHRRSTSAHSFGKASPRPSTDGARDTPDEVCLVFSDKPRVLTNAAYYAMA